MKMKYDKNKPNGTPRKIVDTSLAKKYGEIKFNLDDGFDLTFKDFKKR